MNEPIIEIFTIPSGPFETNGYLVIIGTSAALIDAPPGLHEKIEEIIEERNLHLEQLILTHSHWDHIADASMLKKLYHMPLSIHEEDLPNLLSPGADKMPFRMHIAPCTPDLLSPGADKMPFRMHIAPCTPDRILKDEDLISIGGTEWQVIHTPGHSPGGISLFQPDEKILFSGDTLFKSSIGNLSFPTSEPDRMWPSLKRLSTLPAETRVFPGHGPSTTIGQERWLSRAEQVFG